MQRGRKPTPDHLKVVSGNPGGRPIAGDGPKPERVELPPPGWLDAKAKLVWERLLPHLYRWNLFTALDVDQLAVYCQAVATLDDTAQKIRETGTVVQSPTGFPIQNPYLAIYNRAAEQVRQFGAEFGLSPSARVRLKGVAQGDLFDGFDEFVQKRA